MSHKIDFNIIKTILLLSTLLFASFSNNVVSKEVKNTENEQTRPNIVVIVADDLGLTDLGAFGSEIETPNLDALANSGVKLTNFYTAPTCSPTRSMLLSGTDNHIAGMGAMNEYLKEHATYLTDKPGYEGYLNYDVATLPEVMSNSGYETFMAGKWHIGDKEGQRPKARGFQRSFALLNGGAGHLDDLAIMPLYKTSHYVENDKTTKLPKSFYSTTFYTKQMKKYIDARDKSKPFLSYLAYTAPHWPLQAPDDSIAKFKGKYDQGYEVLLANRIAKQKELGLLDKSIKIPPLPKNIKPWDNLTAQEKKVSAKKMEIYAAMISDLDEAVGDFVSYLKRENLYENTVIFFMSDNGAEGKTPDIPPFKNFLQAFVKKCCDNSYNNMGKANSYVMYGPEWARASTGVSRLFKSSTAEGGIQSPAFVHFPKQFKSGEYNGLLSVMDIMPTILDLTNTEHPYNKNNKQNDVHPMRGKSIVNMLSGISSEVHSKEYVLGWELHGNKSVRKGDWKLLNLAFPIGNGQWRLYNLANDPSELNDLSKSHPNKFKEMKLAWEKYANEVGVQPIKVHNKR